MNIIRKSRGTKLPRQAQRVFLSYNKHNIVDRDNIISDLLSLDAGTDCIVSYLENPDTAIDEKFLRSELLETQLLVIMVTLKMLCSIVPEKLLIEYRIAQELNTPILPILTDNGLFSLYEKKFGPIHCIAKSEIEYRIKLMTQLEIFLASDETIERIREKAFTSAIFMSYRRINLDEARRFMKFFHDLDSFESVAICYDNFLTAGTDFDEGIKESIFNSNALALIVTPDLATEGNYIQEKEYPFAQKIGIPIVPVEATPTSQDLFFKLFPDAKCPVPLDNTIELRKTFREKLGEAVFAKQLDSERAYLLGMAYLKGIDVESDFSRGIKLLSDAAKDYTTASIDAANQLASIYEKGIGIDISFDNALQWYQRALAICIQVLGSEHPDTAGVYNNIAVMYDSQGNYPEALKWYEKALTVKEKILGKEHPSTAATYSNMALVYKNQGNYPMSLKWYKKALVIKEKILGREHPDTAFIYNNMALVFQNQGNYPEALGWHEKALAIKEKVLGKEHPDTAATYNNMAGIYANHGDYPEALKWHEKALTIKEKIFGSEHPDTAITYNNMALVFQNQGNYPQALEWHEKALAIKEKVFGKEHPDTAGAYNNIAIVYNSQEDYHEALKWFKKALAIYEQIFGNEHPDTATTYSNIASVYDSLEDYSGALEWYKRALVIMENVFGREHPDTASIYNNIALAYQNQEHYNEATKWYKKALVIKEKILGKEHPDTALTYYNIASFYYNQKNYPKALEWLQKALIIFEGKLGKEHPYTISVYNYIAEIERS